MNKYAENISDIITLDATEEIVDIFLESLEKTDKTTGIIANKEFIEYAMGEALAHDWINVRRVDIELDELEYMLSVDDDGDLVVQPVADYNDKYFSSMGTVYISMDGDVSQDIIDDCIDRDVNVILFGYEDEPKEECDCKECTCKTDDGNTYHITLSGNVNMDTVGKLIESMDNFAKWSDMTERMLNTSMSMRSMLNDMNRVDKLLDSLYGQRF